MCSDSTRVAHVNGEPRNMHLSRISSPKPRTPHLPRLGRPSLHCLRRARRRSAARSRSFEGRYRRRFCCWSRRPSSMRPMACWRGAPGSRSITPGLRRRPPRRHRRLPDLRLRAGAAPRIAPACCRRDGRSRWSAAVLLSSAYGFCAADAKTDDHFFTGFPSTGISSRSTSSRRGSPPVVNGAHPARAERARLRADRLRLSDAHAGAARPDDLRSAPSGQR